MTDHKDLPTPAQMQKIVRVYFDGGSVYCFAVDDDGNERTIHWVGNFVYNPRYLSIHGDHVILEDVILPILHNVTGHAFHVIKYELDDNSTCWIRDDHRNSYLAKKLTEIATSKPILRKSQ